MGFDEYARSRRRQRLLIDQAQAAVMAALDYARIAGHATVTLDEHQTPASRAAAAAAHTRARHAARTALDAVARLAAPDPDTTQRHDHVSPPTARARQTSWPRG